MRNARQIALIAALVAPLFLGGMLWAAENTDAALTNAEDDATSGVGGGITAETPATTEGAVVTGRVVGTNCWLARGFEGEKYRDSAIMCARKGTPLAILTDAGSLIYPITLGSSGNARPDMDKVMSYAEQRVTVTGKLIGRGRERAIVIDNIAPAPEPKKARTFTVKEKPNEQVVGRVVDVSCWLNKGGAATADPKCVGDCAMGGDPLVIVTDAGRIYYPVTMAMPQNPVGITMLSGYCAQKVRVTGTTIARGEGRAIIIDKVEPLAAKAKGPK